MPAPEKPLLHYVVVIKEGQTVEIDADSVEIYENGVPQFFRKGKIVAAFNVFEFFTQVGP
jgi:hypothetical protein